MKKEFRLCRGNGPNGRRTTKSSFLTVNNGKHKRHEIVAEQFFYNSAFDLPAAAGCPTKLVRCPTKLVRFSTKLVRCSTKLVRDFTKMVKFFTKVIGFSPSYCNFPSNSTIFYQNDKNARLAWQQIGGCSVENLTIRFDFVSGELKRMFSLYF